MSPLLAADITALRDAYVIELWASCLEMLDARDAEVRSMLLACTMVQAERVAELTLQRTFN